MEYLWFVFAILSALMGALVAIFAKAGLQSVDANTASAIRALVMTILLFLVIAIQGNLKLIPDILENRKALGFIILSGVAGASSWLFYFLALKYGKVTQVITVDKLSVVLGTLMAVIFLKEMINSGTIIGVIVITIGVIIVTLS